MIRIFKLDFTFRLSRIIPDVFSITKNSQKWATTDEGVNLIKIQNRVSNLKLVAVAQLAELSLPTPEIRSSNIITNNFYVNIYLMLTA